MRRGAVILSVDPSVRSAGVAVFDNRTLIAAHRVTIAKADGEDPVNRWRRMALKIVLLAPEGVRTLIAERPQIYQRGGGRTKGDPNDLLGLAGVVGALAAYLPLVEVRSVLPATWKGQVSKEPMSTRILMALSPEERALVPPSHDAIDAIGIGLHAIGRLVKRMVIPR